MKKRAGSLYLTLGVLLLAVTLYLIPSPRDIYKGPEKDLPTGPVVTLAFVGDIMLDRGVLLHINKYGGGNFSFAFDKASEKLRSYDIVLGNLEGPISDVGKRSGTIYSFRMDPRSVQAIKDAGFDILSVANNHMGDWGLPAMADTFKRLKNAGILYSGGGDTREEAYTARVLEKNGTKFAFLSFSDFNPYLEAGSSRPGIALATDIEEVRSAIEKALLKADIVIVTFHFGTEYLKAPDKRQRELAEVAVRSGADLVIGHHPHVVQPLEMYQGKYIAFSLGNFVFDQYFSKATLEGGLLEVTVQGKEIQAVTLRRFPINKHFQPELQW